VTTVGDVRSAVASRRMSDRLWLYATYHCNLRCSYCLTESSPRIRDRRELVPKRMAALVAEAAPLGFGTVGVTGGEVFMLPGMADALAEMAAVLPTTALTNGTLITDRLLQKLAPLRGHYGFALQLSLELGRSGPERRAARPRQFRKGVRLGPPPHGAAHPRAHRNHCGAPDARRAGAPVRPAPHVGGSATTITSSGRSCGGAAHRPAAWGSCRSRATSCPS